jgi:lysozyme family protein
MADVEKAVQFVLGLEDARLKGDVTTLPGDRGGPTRFGLASASHPDLVADGYYEVDNDEPKIPHDEALAIAEKVYAEQYGAKVHIEEIDDQDVANRVLGFAINEGSAEATAVLQRALNSLGASIAEDGRFGPATLTAVNAADPDSLIAALRSFERQFYAHLVSVRPELMPFYRGFLNRADA